MYKLYEMLLKIKVMMSNNKIEADFLQMIRKSAFLINESDRQMKYPLTEQGLNKLKEELKTLESVKRPIANNRVKAARRFCDFNEDATFQEAVQELAQIDKRRKQIEHIIRHATIIEKDTKETTIKLGSTVTFQELLHHTETYTIVGKAEANPLEGTISIESPFAKGLLGAKRNDIVPIYTPEGEIKVKVLAIH